jgi:apolipoprotein D and lipocalin family protein
LLELAGCTSTSKLKVVSNFDADRYTGVWYEAARYPHRFEKGMSAVSATYSFNENGTIKVLNRGYVDGKQEWEEIEGVAKYKGSKDQGWLKVSFFKPFYASYKILYLDENYTKAIVTGPSYGYLWILVRDPKLPDSELNELIGKIKKLGFDSEKLIIVDQSKNPS